MIALWPVFAASDCEYENRPGDAHRAVLRFPSVFARDDWIGTSAHFDIQTRGVCRLLSFTRVAGRHTLQRWEAHPKTQLWRSRYSSCF